MVRTLEVNLDLWQHAKTSILDIVPSRRASASRFGGASRKPALAKNAKTVAKGALMVRRLIAAMQCIPGAHGVEIQRVRACWMFVFLIYLRVIVAVLYNSLASIGCQCCLCKAVLCSCAALSCLPAYQYYRLVSAACKV
jgi:hypothetical protein